MDLQQEISRLVRQSIMEEINNLGVRAAIREMIESAGIASDDIKKMVQDVADSYFRSAMGGNVEDKIARLFDNEISKAVSVEVEKVVGKYSGWNGSTKVKDALNSEIARVVSKGFDITVDIKPAGHN